MFAGPSDNSCRLLLCTTRISLLGKNNIIKKNFTNGILCLLYLKKYAKNKYKMFIIIIKQYK